MLLESLFKCFKQPSYWQVQSPTSVIVWSPVGVRVRLIHSLQRSGRPLDFKFRRFLEERHLSYVIAVPKSQWVSAGWDGERAGTVIAIRGCISENVRVPASLKACRVMLAQVFPARGPSCASKSVVEFPGSGNSYGADFWVVQYFY